MKLKTDGLLNAASKATMLICGFLLVWYLTRKLGLSTYGEYSATVLLSMWFRFPIEVLLHSSIVPMLAASRDPDQVAAALMRATLVASLVATVLALFTGLILSVCTGLVSMRLWYPLSLDVLIQSLASAYMASLLGRGHFGYAALVFGLYWIFRTVSTILLVELGTGAFGAALVLPIASTVQLLLCASKDRLGIICAPRVSWQSIWEQVSQYGLNVGLGRLLFNMDLVVMKFIGADSRALSFYAAAKNLAQAFQAIAEASNQIHLHSLSRSFSQGDYPKFRAASETLLRDRAWMAGLGILSVPYLPMVTDTLLGKEYQQIQGVSVGVLLAAILALFYSAGRIINRATQEPRRIWIALCFFIVFNVAGCALIILTGPHGVELSASQAVDQATRCAMVPLLGIATLSIYTLKIGMDQVAQQFPWRFLVAAISVGSVLSVIASFAPCRGLPGFVAGLLFSGIYFGVILGFRWFEERQTQIARVERTP